MAAATFDVKDQVQQGRPGTPRRVEIPFELDFAGSKLGDGTGLAANEDMEFGLLPAGYVHERLDAKLITAEGEAATLDVGIDGDLTLFAAALNLNGTPNATIAQNPSAVAIATADADATYGQPEADLVNEIKGDVNTLVSNINTERAKAGKYFHTNTAVRVRCPNGANTINVAKVRLTFIGYMSDTGNER